MTAEYIRGYQFYMTKEMHTVVAREAAKRRMNTSTLIRLAIAKEIGMDPDLHAHARRGKPKKDIAPVANIKPFSTGKKRRGPLPSQDPLTAAFGNFKKEEPSE